MKADLHGQTVIVTRPVQQAAGLTQAIEQAGGVPVSFPTLEIVAVTDNASVRVQWQRLADYQWIIFISANAVNFAARMNSGRITLPETIQVAAIGQATARALERFGVAVDCLPETGSDTEALLAMPVWQDIEGKRVLIVRGVGGRETLADTLRQHQAVVDYMEVYRRIKPKCDTRQILNLLHQQKISAIVLMSGEALLNLWDMLNHEDALLSIPIVVISSRIASMAETIGFKQIAVSQGPSETAIIQTLMMLNSGEKRG